MEPIYVVTYRRASTMKQVTKGEGLDVQDDRNRAFCASSEFIIDDDFVDEGVSGDLEVFERPDLLRLLQHCKEHAGRVKYVIIDRVDRFSRDLFQRLFVEHELAKYGVKVLFALQDSLNSTGDDANAAMITAMRDVMTVFAQFDLHMIRQRLRDGMRMKASKGHKPVGRQPFGYTYDLDGKGTVPNKAEAEVLHIIFTYRARGLSYAQVATFLDATITEEQRQQFSKANRSRNWSAQSIQAIVQNDYYLGVVTYQNKKIQGNHPQLIETELWMQANDVDKRKKTAA